MDSTTFYFVIGVVACVGLVSQVAVIYALVFAVSQGTRAIRNSLESPRLNARAERLGRFAERARIDFQAEADPTEFQQLPFNLFRQPRGLRLPGLYQPEPVRNLFQWRSNEADFRLFDFLYRFGKGHLACQTVCLISSPRRNLPRFTLRPELRIEEPLERLLPLLVAITTTKDIDFDQQPEFSRDYFLSSTDDEVTRTVFTDRVISCIREFPVRYKVDADGQRFVIYRPSITLEESEIAALVDHAGKLLQVFTER